MQAARGTPLSPGHQVARRPGERRQVWWVFLGTALVAYLLDQATKVWAVHALADRGRVPLLGDLLGLDLIRNPGAAFSTGTRFTVGFTLLAIVATVVVLWLFRRVRTPLWAVGLGLLLAGITGNLTDRLLRDPGPFRGHVVDFLQLPNWPIFNVADMCLNAGVAVVVVQAVRGVRLDGSRVQSGDAESTHAEDDAEDDAQDDAQDDAETTS